MLCRIFHKYMCGSVISNLLIFFHLPQIFGVRSWLISYPCRITHYKYSHNNGDWCRNNFTLILHVNLNLVNFLSLQTSMNKKRQRTSSQSRNSFLHWRSCICISMRCFEYKALLKVRIRWHKIHNRERKELPIE